MYVCVCVCVCVYAIVLFPPQRVGVLIHLFGGRIGEGWGWVVLELIRFNILAANGHKNTHPLSSQEGLLTPGNMEGGIDGF